MSRIGKAPIPVPDKVDVNLQGLTVTVKGPKGELSRTLPDGIAIVQEGTTLVVSPTGPSRRSRERHGLCRTLVANMVEGVSQGFVRKLEIVGVGYRASLQGTKLVVSAGYSHPVEMEPPRRRNLRRREQHHGAGLRPRQGIGRQRSRQGARHPPARALQGQGH